MTTLVIGAGLIGSQVARILVERGEKPVLMDHAAQPQAIGQIVDLDKVTLVVGDVLRPLSIIDVLRTHDITKIAHTAANPLLTLGAQKEPYSAINLNIMGTVNVLEAARITGLKRVVVSSSSVLNSLPRRRRGRGQLRPRGGVPAADHVLLGDQAGGREPRPQLREVVRHRVRRPALRRGVRAVERRGRRRAVEHHPRGDAKTRSPAARRPSRRARWSGSIPRTRRAAR